MRIMLRAAIGPHFQRFLPKPCCRCPLCGTERVERRRKRDHVDRASMRPASIIQYLLGGHLYHCLNCRLQFYDLRPLARARQVFPAR
jgi:hypothetical protein